MTQSWPDFKIVQIQLPCFLQLLVLALLGSCYAQYQYPEQGSAAGVSGGPVGVSPAAVATPEGGVNNRILGLGSGLLGGGGLGGGLGGGRGGIGGLFSNLFGGLLGGGNNAARPPYPAPLPVSPYGGGYPGYGGGFGAPGYAGGFGYPGGFGGGYGPGYGGYYG